jgi:hypothetical protein
MFTDKDLKQIQNKGIEVKTVQQQIESFKSSFPPIQLHAAAIPGNGIHCYTEEEVQSLSSFFDAHFKDYEILKFVPASGAASRMFKSLFEFHENYNGSEADLEDFNKDQGFNSPYNFFKYITHFAFYQKLKDALSVKGMDIDELIVKNDFGPVLDIFLTENGLNYAGLPKGLLLFHDYPDGPRLSVEEHLVEAAHYSRDKNNISRIHLTVSPEHLPKFKQSISEKIRKYEQMFNIGYSIGFSEQKPSTDTIAVDPDNNPFRKEDGSLLFRPGGHGALIENLKDLNGEIIFVKNIDNVVPDRLRETTYSYKKVIGGLLFQLQEKCFDSLGELEEANLDDTKLESIKVFAVKELNIYIPPAYEAYEKMEKIDFLFNKLNRPMRVCGMVKNEGEPGGGPFWVVNENDDISLQIVESAQMNLSDASQKAIVDQSTHFNPVDLVCAVRNYRGEAFKLNQFIDPDTGLISVKSLNGKELKAQELPGLWNGAMADWITIFVETPLITFNPVKTINDLLRPQHQGK